jgi:hypothetical protein
MQIEIRRTDALRPYARNPRRNDQAVEQMVASIREFGFKIPLLVRSDGEVVDGHLRLKAAIALHLEELPVILCDEWTPAQVKAFRLMVNRSATWVEYPDTVLRRIMHLSGDQPGIRPATGASLAQLGAEWPHTPEVIDLLEKLAKVAPIHGSSPVTTLPGGSYEQ